MKRPLTGNRRRQRVLRAQEAKRRKALHRRTQEEAFERVVNLFEEIAAELNLPEDPEQWDYEDYEDERNVMGERLVGVFAKIIVLRRELKAFKAGQHPHQKRASRTARARARAGGSKRGSPLPTRSRLGEGVVLETDENKSAVVVPLESGVFLVADTDRRLLEASSPDSVGAAIEEAAYASLSGTPCSHWTRKL